VIADLDEVLRQLLIREIDIKGNEVEIAFDTPKRDWSSRLSKPTINLYLFDIRENLRLRGSEQFHTLARPDGTSEVRRNPVRMDLRYLMTAWVKEAEDEHLLLSAALMALLRHPFIPDDLTQERLHQPQPVPLEVASFPPEAGPVDKHSEIWGVLSNEMRPGILVTITLSIDPYAPVIFTQVRTRETRFVQSTGQGGTQTGAAVSKVSVPARKPASKTYWSLGGTVKSEKYGLSTLSLLLVEKKLAVELSEEGKFVLHGLPEGEYHLDIVHNAKILKRQKLVVPAPDYEILV
jgi:hypothetical protein